MKSLDHGSDAGFIHVTFIEWLVPECCWFSCWRERVTSKKISEKEAHHIKIIITMMRLACRDIIKVCSLPGSSTDHANLFFVEWILDFHVEINMLEVNGVSNRHIAHMLTELSVRVYFYHQFKLPN
jgi:hypothetical protein